MTIQEKTRSYESLSLGADGIRLKILGSPEDALREFSKSGNRSLGKDFVAQFRDDPKYHDSAYFVSVELGEPIERTLGEVAAAGVGDAEGFGRVSVEDRARSFCGNHVSAGNFWEENQIDDYNRAREDAPAVFE